MAPINQNQQTLSNFGVDKTKTFLLASKLFKRLGNIGGSKIISHAPFKLKLLTDLGGYDFRTLYNISLWPQSTKINKLYQTLVLVKQNR